MGSIFSAALVFIKILVEYRTVVEALIEFIETHHDDKIRAESMDSITRGLKYATETGETTELEKALREHCASDNCLIP